MERALILVWKLWTVYVRMLAVTAILSCVIKIRGTFKSTKWRHFENVKFEALSALRAPLFKINMHHQNVEPRPFSNSICTTCQDLNKGPSACKLSVQTTTPPVLDTILIEQQAIILPR